MTTVAYVGFLVGPAGVGLASSLTSLPTALVGVAFVAVLFAALAPAARRASSPERCSAWQGDCADRAVT